MVDVLEHFTKKDGIKLLDICVSKSDGVLISTPKNVSSQGSVFNNEHEEHVSQWTIDDFAKWPGHQITNKSILYYIGK